MSCTRSPAACAAAPAPGRRRRARTRTRSARRKQARFGVAPKQLRLLDVLACVTIHSYSLPMSNEGNRPTMRQVADAAGVSPMTVSYAFSQPERVAESTRRKVLENERGVSPGLLRAPIRLPARYAGGGSAVSASCSASDSRMPSRTRRRPGSSPGWEMCAPQRGWGSRRRRPPARQVTRSVRRTRSSTDSSRGLPAKTIRARCRSGERAAGGGPRGAGGPRTPCGGDR